jgi:Mlc titration factor MtfA (ptsG expression regulator)
VVRRVRGRLRGFLPARHGDHVNRRGETRIDPYAAENPAEFFAVLSEAFFEIPHAVRDDYADVYGQLAAFYRQDPAARWNGSFEFLILDV